LSGGEVLIVSGPPSELGRLVQADREAREINRHKPKAPAPIDVTLPPGFTTAPWDRPPLPQARSFESTTPDQHVEDMEEGHGSETGDGEESVTGSVRDGASPASRGRGSKTGKAKPRKSKLAQEIVPLSATDTLEYII